VEWLAGTLTAENLAERIKELSLRFFNGGRLLRPSPEVLNTVDLGRAAASLAGVESVGLTDGARSIADAVAHSDHLVFVLADGLGMDLLEGLGGGLFLLDHLAAELRAVFPSTTPTALTSLATCEWPNRHAALGWDVYLPEVEAVATIIRFFRRRDEVPLTNSA
jgi:hypothetical protein